MQEVWMLSASIPEEWGDEKFCWLNHMSRKINFDSVVLVSAATSKEMRVMVMFLGYWLLAIPDLKNDKTPDFTCFQPDYILQLGERIIRDGETALNTSLHLVKTQIYYSKMLFK